MTMLSFLYNIKKSKKAITASNLREKVYRILDEIIRIGVPVDIE